jgi:uncharacterized protein (DUF362 family)
MHECISRRKWLATVSATAAATLIRPHKLRADDLPTSPVAIGRCKTYGSEVQSTLAAMFEQLGGLEWLVSGKTVAIKINLVGAPWSQVGDLPPEATHWTHPAVIAAAVKLLGQAGAASIRILECGGDVNEPLEDWMKQAGWNVELIRSAAANVEFENTNGLGSGSEYARVYCPAGGHIFPAFDLNHSYVDCDVFISMPKLKEHRWFGATLSMKNCYGMTPLTIYGDSAGVEEPGATASGTRVSVFHVGQRAPSLTAPQEIDPNSSRDGDYRIPRIVADIVSARPVHLAIIDGVTSMAGGEGPWCPDARPVSPGVLLAGFNPVTTDAVALAVMGFDPKAERGTAPFEGTDSFLTFAEELGLGTRDLAQIEVLGTPIEQVRFDFRSA